MKTPCAPQLIFATAALVLLQRGGAADQRDSSASAKEGLVPGLVATYRDDVRTVSEAVALPELGLAANESPHPAVKPDFAASYEGYLEVRKGGRFRFETQGALSIGGEPVTGERALDVGLHAISLTLKRQPGELRFGLLWRSENFVEEPVPPAAFWRARDSAVVSDEVGDHPSPPHRIRKAFAEMKCVSCHDAQFLATMHHKFDPDSLLTLMRHANTSKWYGAMSGPLFDESKTLEELAADLRKLPRGRRARSEAGMHPNGAKYRVGTKSGYGCIACHGIKHHLTYAESKGTNLALIAERVSYDWFVRWMEDPGRLKPGVAMPAFFAGQEAAERQKNIDALWDYLSQGDQMELPEELLVDSDQFVLKPAGGPVYTRAYMRLPNGRELLRAICVGLPNGVSYCFDAETCQIAYIWTGGFLDMAPQWQNQSGHPTPAIGNAFHVAAANEGLRIGDRKPSFRGYELVEGIPRFEFAFGDTAVRLLVDAPSPDCVRLSFRVGARNDPITFVRPSLPSPISVQASQGVWKENRLAIADSGNVEFTLTMERGK